VYIYRQRHPTPQGWQRRHLAIALPPEDWAYVDAWCAEDQDSLAYVIRQLVRRGISGKAPRESATKGLTSDLGNWRGEASRADLAGTQR